MLRNEGELLRRHGLIVVLTTVQEGYVVQQGKLG